MASFFRSVSISSAARISAAAAALWPAGGASAIAGPLSGAVGGAAPAPEPATGPLAWVLRGIVEFQREANREIAAHMGKISAGEPGALWIGLGLAFLYGVIHAAGPGHGKLVVVSYFLAQRARIARGLRMGAEIAFFHVVSAVIVVALADILLRQAFAGPPAEVLAVRLVSYGAILAIGLLMLRGALRRAATGAAHGHDLHHSHGHGHGHAHGHPADETRTTRQRLLSLAVGLVPCTGAVLVMLYALANDIVAAGALLVAAIGIGMALTMGGLGLFAVAFRGWVARPIEAGGPTWPGHALAILGALAIAALGALLFYGAWSQPAMA
jgi:ABC-type nickel/cobalt efflux system permease component RcnA